MKGAEQGAQCVLHRRGAEYLIVSSNANTQRVRFGCSDCARSLGAGDSLRLLKDVEKEIDDYMKDMRRDFIYNQLDKVASTINDQILKMRNTIQHSFKFNVNYEEWELMLNMLGAIRDKCKTDIKQVQEFYDRKSQVQSRVEYGRQISGRTSKCREKVTLVTNRCIYLFEKLNEAVSYPTKEPNGNRKDDFSTVMAAEEIIDLQVTDLLRQQISAQANSARAIAANNAELTKQVESLKNEIKRNELDFELKVKGYKEQVSQLEVTKNNKEVELERLKESKDRYKSDASLNQRAIEQRNSELENIQLRLRDEQKVTDSLRTDLRMAQEKIYQQQSQLKTSKAEQQRLQRYVASLQQTLEEHKQNISQLNVQLSKRNEDYIQLEREQGRLQRQVKKTELELTSVIQQLAKSRQEEVRLAKLLEVAEKEHFKIKEQSSYQLNLEVDKLKRKETELAQLQQQLGQAHRANSELSNESNQFKRYSAELEKIKSKLEADLLQKQAESNEQRQELGRERQTSQGLRAALKTKEVQLKRKEDQLAGLQRNIQSKQSERDSQKSMKERVEQELNNQIQTLQNQLREQIRASEESILRLRNDSTKQIKELKHYHQQELRAKESAYLQEIQRRQAIITQLTEQLENTQTRLENELQKETQNRQRAEAQMREVQAQKDGLEKKLKDTKDSLYFLNSTMFVEEEWKLKLINLLRSQLIKVVDTELIFRSNEHIRSPQVLHSIYDKLKNTLIVIRSKDNTFGGFIDASFEEIKDDKSNTKNKRGFLFSLKQKEQNIFTAKQNKRLITYEQKDSINLGSSDLRIIDESKVFSNFGIFTCSFNHLDVPEPKRYFGGEQEFPIEGYEIYQLKFE